MRSFRRTQHTLITWCFMLLAMASAYSSQAAAPDDKAGTILAAAYADPQSVRIRRFDGNPIIRPDMLPGEAGRNINGPSLIRVPAWVRHPLGRYYLYFAHHSGSYIRLAYADQLEGPWRIHEPGTLRLEDAPHVQGHVASPEVVIDEDARQIRMYFHGVSRAARSDRSRQRSFVAISDDGLTFSAQDEDLGLFYFRVFEYGGRHFALSKGGRLYSSANGLSNFVDHGDLFPAIKGNDPDYNAPGSVRHVATYVSGDMLHVLYTRIGDAPERILLTQVDISAPVDTWQPKPAIELLRPSTGYEGADLPVTASRAGAEQDRLNALRDPAIHVEAGHVFVLYSVAGESGIGLAEILPRE